MFYFVLLYGPYIYIVLSHCKTTIPTGKAFGLQFFIITQQRVQTLGIFPWSHCVIIRVRLQYPSLAKMQDLTSQDKHSGVLQRSTVKLQDVVTVIGSQDEAGRGNDNQDLSCVCPCHLGSPFPVLSVLSVTHQVYQLPLM